MAVCEAREMYGRSALQLHPHAYESVFLPPPYGESRDACLAWWRLKEDAGQQHFIENDDLGIGYVRKFIQFEGSAVGWFHLVVRARGLGEFFERFQEYVDPADDSKRHRAFLLEFSCWCDGGERYADPIYRHHRHMIAVARNGKGFFEQCWKKVDNPFKLCHKIQSRNDLRNVLFYVSSRKSSCNFGVTEDEDEEDKCKTCHFYVFRPLTSNFNLRASLALDDGVEGIREMISSLEKPATSFASKCSRGPDGCWRVKICKLIDPQIESLCGTNLDSAENDWWYPPKHQQRVLDQVVPLVKKIESMRRFDGKRLKELKDDLDREREKYDKLMDAFIRISLESKNVCSKDNEILQGEREEEM